MANVIITPEQSEEELVSQIESLASRLGGKMEQTITLNSVGRSSKKPGCKSKVIFAPVFPSNTSGTTQSVFCALA